MVLGGGLSDGVGDWGTSKITTAATAMALRAACSSINITDNTHAYGPRLDCLPSR